MKNALILPASVALAFVLVAEPAMAEEGWLAKLNPFAKKEKSGTLSARTYNVKNKRAEPSALEKLGTGTKKLLAGARDTLTWKKPAPKRKPTNQYVPWMQNPKNPRYARSQQKKKSWLGSLFRREEPKRVQTLKEFVGMPRPGM